MGYFRPVVVDGTGAVSDEGGVPMPSVRQRRPASSRRTLLKRGGAALAGLSVTGSVTG